MGAKVWSGVCWGGRMAGMGVMVGIAVAGFFPILTLLILGRLFGTPYPYSTGNAGFGFTQTYTPPKRPLGAPSDWTP